MLLEHLLKTKKEHENLKTQEIQDIFTKISEIKPACKMIWLLVARRTASDKVLRDKAFNTAKTLE